MTETEVAVVRAYLCDGRSHREIQQEVLEMDAPLRGGGFEAMKILHKFGIKGAHKSALRGRQFNPQEFERAGSIQSYLRQNR